MSAGAGSPAPQPATGQSGKPRVPTREPSSYVIGDLTQPSESAQPKKAATDFQFDKEFTGHLTQEDIDEQVRMEKERKSWELLKGIDYEEENKAIWPSNGSVSGPFGEERWYARRGKVLPHQGLDLRNKIGAPVFASRHGRIVDVLYDKHGYGYYIIIQYRDGTQGLYAHNRPNVSKEQEVRRGDIVARTDNSGSSNGPHVHYGLKDKSGEFINPEWALPRR